MFSMPVSIFRGLQFPHLCLKILFSRNRARQNWIVLRAVYDFLIILPIRLCVVVIKHVRIYSETMCVLLASAISMLRTCFK